MADGDHDRWHIVLPREKDVIVVRDQNTLLVATVRCGEDAPLVAAAPRLKAALADMVKWYGRRGGADDALLPADQQEPEIAEARRALEEAETQPAPADGPCDEASMHLGDGMIPSPMEDQS